MNVFAIAILNFAPVAIFLFLTFAGFTPRNVAISLVATWLVLPTGQIKFEGVSPFDKPLVLSCGLLVSLLMMRPDLLLNIRPNWVDLPILLWCTVPFASSIDNDLGVHDGCTAVFRTIMVWGIPYLIGRAVFTDTKAIWELLRAIFLGGIAYAPLVLFESRMGPQLQPWIYGDRSQANFETIAFWGPLSHKPSVFLQCYLELTPLMGIATLFGYWLWSTGRIGKIAGISAGMLVCISAGAALLCKSLGGCFLTACAFAVLWATNRSRTWLFLVLFSLVAPTYLVARITDAWNGKELVDFLSSDVSDTRAGSFNYRLLNEDMLKVRAMQRPVFGWGGWGRALVRDSNDRLISVIDGMWIIALGNNGFVGLIALFATLLLPVWLLAATAPPGSIANQFLSGPVVLAIAITVHAIDCLANAFPNPFYFVGAGALAAIVVHRRSLSSSVEFNERTLHSGLARRLVGESSIRGARPPFTYPIRRSS